MEAMGDANRHKRVIQRSKCVAIRCRCKRASAKNLQFQILQANRACIDSVTSSTPLLSARKCRHPHCWHLDSTLRLSLAKSPLPVPDRQSKA